MSYVSVYSRPASTPNSNGHSVVSFLATSDNYEELFMNVKSFNHGIVKVFDLDTLEPVGTVFPSGRITLRTEYRGE